MSVVIFGSILFVVYLLGRRREPSQRLQAIIRIGLEIVVFFHSLLAILSGIDTAYVISALKLGIIDDAYLFKGLWLALEWVCLFIGAPSESTEQKEIQEKYTVRWYFTLFQGLFLFLSLFLKMYYDGYQKEKAIQEMDELVAAKTETKGTIISRTNNTRLSVMKSKTDVHDESPLSIYTRKRVFHTDIKPKTFGDIDDRYVQRRIGLHDIFAEKADSREKMYSHSESLQSNNLEVSPLQSSLPQQPIHFERLFNFLEFGIIILNDIDILYSNLGSVFANCEEGSAVRKLFKLDLLNDCQSNADHRQKTLDVIVNEGRAIKLKISKNLFNFLRDEVSSILMPNDTLALRLKKLKLRNSEFYRLNTTKPNIHTGKSETDNKEYFVVSTIDDPRPSSVSRR